MNGFDRAQLEHPADVEVQLAEAFEKNGLSITVSSFTSFISFSSGVFSSIPMIRTFSLFAGIGMIVLWMNTIIIFGPFLCYHAHHVVNRGSDCCGLSGFLAKLFNKNDNENDKFTNENENKNKNTDEREEKQDNVNENQNGIENENKEEKGISNKNKNPSDNSCDNSRDKKEKEYNIDDENNINININRVPIVNEIVQTGPPTLSIKTPSQEPQAVNINFLSKAFEKFHDTFIASSGNKVCNLVISCVLIGIAV
eukprot:CAMPEP_0116902264 /NCGR_PEP_ID=MMETSP0467-20121206/9912_1 /TAXON_ID=283647 /ORGANISM="Mesodinium pulex, Strain SPMC105" /LENGTH=253 /DNA_ID=CAMNT_0004576069 /DNA_START=424 /DNA_END=1185 /DNA_ORIENTATION=-